jgi:soluble P-type ATPase
MIEVTIAGAQSLKLEHLVSDFNGTLALDGALLPGVAERLRELARRVTIHVVTADTFGLADRGLSGLPVRLAVLSRSPHAEAKQRYARDLGALRCAAIGNGRNDALLLATVALGIAVIQGEGAAAQTLATADVVAPDIRVALDLLLNPLRLGATLRG